jgi:hypothetical protein
LAVGRTFGRWEQLSVPRKQDVIDQTSYYWGVAPRRKGGTPPQYELWPPEYRWPLSFQCRLMSSEQFYINYSLNGEHYARGHITPAALPCRTLMMSGGNLALPMSISATSHRKISPTASWCLSRWLWGHDNQTEHKRNSAPNWWPFSCCAMGDKTNTGLRTCHPPGRFPPPYYLSILIVRVVVAPHALQI